ncbi:hypothetical protein [Gordonia alkanivorans]|uniref:hypothetical protein n=1 Tax=Gordonia alkanivorans TaxID=84096 RepID=UPI0024B7586C|nr:hypothetical protein [Gordonia alkanivorans]MDJ0010120.1 hypothetical protein [Gordonia alkanivorans]MDJ0495690.1 hypothetical protein [Gordonia alkanivorans]
MSPHPTDLEVRILDNLEELTKAMEAAVATGDGEAFLDALDESQFADRRLTASRENTWAVWFSNLRANQEVAA